MISKEVKFGELNSFFVVACMFEKHKFPLLPLTGNILFVSLLLYSTTMPSALKYIIYIKW